MVSGTSGWLPVFDPNLSLALSLAMAQVRDPEALADQLGDGGEGAPGAQ